MAQWLGQFSGFTHATKVQDLEESLRQAIVSFDAAPQSRRAPKLKAVHHLSERLYIARFKALHARISSLAEVGKPVENLRKRQQELRAKGVQGILSEFGFISETMR